MKKIILPTLLITSAIGISSVYAAETASYGLEKTDIASYPLYAETANKPPLIMLLLGRDHSMYYEAYNDLTDLNGNGQIDNIFNPEIVYDGIFESNWCYTYNAKYGFFQMDKPASYNNSIYKCGGKEQWSGNFLNYVTSSRMDIVKRILIGGQRYSNLGNLCRSSAGTKQNGSASVDFPSSYKSCFRYDADGGYNNNKKNVPLITRQFIPRDTHVWAKSYNQEDMNARFGTGHNLTDWVPSSYFGSNTSALFGNAGRNLIVVLNSDLLPSTSIGSYTELKDNPSVENEKVFVWNWVARESGSGTPKGAVGIANNLTTLNKPVNVSGSDELTVATKDYFLVVEACNKDTIENAKAPMPARCREYSKDKMNTVGLLQDFSKFSGADAYFGLITPTLEDSYTEEAQKSAALRSPIVDLTVEGNQINQDTGEFPKYTSLMSLINELSLSEHEDTPVSTGGGKTGGFGTSTGEAAFTNASGSWINCTLVNSGSPLYNTLATSQRGCADWGNPLFPMIKLSYDYFKNAKPNGKEDAMNIRLRKFLNDSGNKISFKYANSAGALSPYEREGSSDMPKFDYCYRPVNFILTDESISMDYDTTAMGGDFKDELGKGFAKIEAGEGEFFSGDKVFGEYSGSKRTRDGETIHSLKKVDDYLKVRGVSTLEPNMQGSLKGAAYAAYIHNDASAQISVAGETVAPVEHFAVAMASYLPKFEIYAKNGRKVLFVPFCKAPAMKRSSGTYQDKDEKGKVKFNLYYSYDTEDGYTSNCSIADVFLINSTTTGVGNEQRLTEVEFRVTYEDTESGSDFDMDAIFTYKIKADEDDENLIDVSITGFYSDTYAGESGGYNIFGTAGVITPDYTKCTDKTKACDASSLGYVVDHRTHYIDIMKVDQNASNKGFSLMHSNSDPFNEYNNVTGLDEGSYDGTPTDRVVVTFDATSINSDTKNVNHRENCLAQKERDIIEGSVFYKGDSHYVKFLPSFTNKCNATVTRKFYVTGIKDEQTFFDSPLAYTAYYGSQYGENGNYKSRKAHNPNYFYVSNATKLASQISEALTKAVNAGTNSGTGVAFPALDLSEDQSFVTATFDTTYWTSKLHSNQYNRTTDSMSTSKLSDDIANFSDHKIWIADNKGNLVELTVENLNRSKHPLYDAIFNELGLTACQGKETDERQIITHYIKYLEGSSLWEYKGDEKSSTYDDSTLDAYYTCTQTPFYGFHARRDTSEIGINNDYKLGAIINSTPQFFGNRKIIFAANDGMIHIGTVAPGSTEVKITDSIIPYVSQATMPRNAKRRNNDYYLNDGIITISKFKDSNGERIIAIGSLGAAHPGMYALDLTSVAESDKLSSSPSDIMLWELSPNYYRTEYDQKVRNLANLGAIQAKINVYPYKATATGTDARTFLYAIFGNGYNSRDGYSGIAVVNALTGNVLTKDSITGKETGDLIIDDNDDTEWSKPNCRRVSSSGKYYKNMVASIPDDLDGEPEFDIYCYKNGMNQIIAYDQNHNNIPDFIYSTDLYGNVFRINTYDSDGKKAEPKDWVLTHIHTTVDPDGNVQSITTAPQLAKDSRGYPMVIVASGRYLGKSDLYTTDLQSIWAISDKKFNQNPDTGTELIASGTAMDQYRNAIGDNGTSRLYKFSMLARNVSEEACKLDYGNDFTLLAGNRCRSQVTESGSSDPIIYDAQFYDGWLMDLEERNNRNKASERVYRNMIVLDRHLLVTSMLPGESECKGGGSSNFFDLNIWSADFYNNPNESQTYSDNIYSEMTLAYDKRSDAEINGTNSKTDPDEPSNGLRDRNSASYGCTEVIVGRGDSNNTAEVSTVHKYCPHVKSWQRIYH